MLDSDEDIEMLVYSRCSGVVGGVVDGVVGGVVGGVVSCVVGRVVGGVVSCLMMDSDEYIEMLVCSSCSDVVGA